jgi:hypothetical protein
MTLAVSETSRFENELEVDSNNVYRSDKFLRPIKPMYNKWLRWNKDANRF